MPEIRAQDAFREKGGEAWAALNEQTDAMLAPYGRAALEALQASPGECVLDVGCGCGTTVLELAARVAPDGRVTGVDISEPMLALARKRCANNPQIELVLEDAALQSFAVASFDALFSRFGVMFFADPLAAFSRLRQALRPRGRLAFVCWQAMAANEWATVPLSAARRALPHAELPPLLNPDKPGPFFFADPKRVEQILRSAGFGNVRIEPFEVQTSLGAAGTLTDALSYVCQIGPTARLLAEVDPNLHDAARKALSDALAEYMTENGVQLRGAAFVVTASNAG
ncbi:MAG TPA: methyltransferase domain-containing protein [Polyangiaceae bacterium]|jgi:SAM-dependent methyltransferase